MRSFSVFSLDDFPLIGAGDDIAETIVKTSESNCFEIEDGDIIVISQKIFSKSEKRVVSLKNVVPSLRARRLAKTTGKDARFIEFILRETRSVLKASPSILIVKDKRGLICINAGIDKSNVEGSLNVALLPENPDRSAEMCRQEIRRLTGKNVAVVMCDTYSRPFRRGQVNYAIGVSGLRLFRDYRGKKDLFGNVLKVKNVALIDEVAATAELLMGQGAEATPVVILRGLDATEATRENSPIKDLLISGKKDLFKGVL